MIYRYSLMTAGNWQSSSNIIRKVLMMKIHLCIVASVAILILPFAAKGESKMPMLKWAGKEKVVNHHNDVPFRVLERKWGFCSHAEARGRGDFLAIKDAKSTKEDGKNLCELCDLCGSENMIIHGDNLAALKALLPQYEGRVKCIYIDPPYNTGNEGWVYNDNVNDPQIKKWLGEVVGKEGEDFSRHDKWLCMMYPRLRLLQKLLADDGAIFISIDDNELYNLKLVCDEIFGCSNFKTMISWQKRYTRSNNTVDFTTVVEYLLVYAKSSSFVVNLLPRNEETDGRYSNPDDDPRGPWKGSSFLNPAKPEQRPNLCYPIVNPNTGKVTNPTRNAWRRSKDVFEQLQAEGRLYWGKDGKSAVPTVKNFLSEARGLTPINFWEHSYAGNTDEGTADMISVLGKKVFDNPKPVRLIQRILEHCTDNDSIVLDSFAGSGTTAHAVLNMNKADGGKRKFILIEMMDYADTVTAERVKRVISGYGQGDKAVEGTGGGFGYYELGEPLMIGENLNEDLPLEKIREYVWYMETRSSLTGLTGLAGKDNPDNHVNPVKTNDPYLLGVVGGTAYYFCYEKDSTVKLNRALLRKLKTKAERYVIYADICLLDDSELEKYNITFKKIPRDIARL